ncbi:MAG: cytidine deaminase [Pirellulaceae bacterium]
MVKPSPTIIEELRQAALAVRRQAYAPYSNFLVGAAILAGSGKLFVGCNVENASYGLTICAERNAIAAMIAAGERKIQAIAVACHGAGSPCGACRQVMAEFGEDYGVFLIDADSGEIAAELTLEELLPHRFRWER